MCGDASYWRERDTSNIKRYYRKGAKENVTDASRKIELQVRQRECQRYKKRYRKTDR